MMRGVMAAGAPETAAAGAATLAKGGNAVDAAVAAAFVSFMAEASIVHLGGSGVAQVFDPRSGQSVVYDFFSAMPGLGRTRPVDKMDFGPVVVDFGPTTQEFYLGRASMAVPGNIAGLCQMVQDFGRLPLPAILEPAILMARDGLPVNPFQANLYDLLNPLYIQTEGMRRIFAANGRIIRAGERLYFPDLAATLTALAEEGEAYARRGRLAQALLADQERNGGLLTAADLEQYEVRQVAPIRLAYREYEILLPPPCSSGGVLTAFTLKVLGALGTAGYPHGSAGHLCLLYEVMAATTRARPFWEQAMETLPPDEAVAYFLSDRFVQSYVEEVRVAMAAARRSPSAAEPPGPANTSHLSVIDEEGLAVSLTTTAGESAGYVVPGTGYIPNNILGEADLHPQGFHRRPAGQRISTMMTPAIVLQNRTIRLVVGSGGSIRIRSAILQTLNNVLDYGMPLEQAVNAPRVHLEGEVLHCEAGYDPQAVDELEARGYPVNRWDRRSLYFGGAHSVARTAGGQLEAAGDDRRGGAVAVA
ncbi:MAG: gamma-glutamyltransferase [Chloroflexota bacterium]